MKFRMTLLLCLAAALAVIPLPAQACVGARALAMGGAFVGLADDASATYWNPAALPDLQKQEATYMHIFNQDINYQDFFAYTQPLSPETAFGVSYIKFQFLPEITEGDSSLSWTQNWYWLSYGAKLTKTVSFGVNLKKIDDHLDFVLDGTPISTSADTAAAIDLAFFGHATNKVTWGLLIQNANEPHTRASVEGEPVLDSVWGVNWRPGVAVCTDDHVIFAAELYDATDNADARGLRLGVEKQFPEQKFAVRAGRYAAGDANGFTAGFGVWGEQWQVDVAYLMGDLDNTWVASVTGVF